VDLNLIELNCEYSNCILTKNRNDFDSSDAVLFHWWDIKWWDVPNYHLTDQKWVLLNDEPPKNCPPIESLEPFGGHINWTLSCASASKINLSSYQIKQKTINSKLKKKLINQS
jgi:hypothetical protein